MLCWRRLWLIFRVVIARASEFWGFDRGMISFVKGRRLGHREQGDEHELTQYIWVIVLNVLFDLVLAVGYLAIGFIIYGGYLYIMSQGDPARAARGKKTLTSAIVGTIIALWHRWR